MKKHIKIKRVVLFIFLGVGFISCSNDFTDLTPISNRNEAQFYNDANDFKTAINASYAGLQDNGVYGRAYWVMFEMRSDNTDQGADFTGLAREYAVINRFTEDALNATVKSAWISSYKVVANCNVILNKIEPIEMDNSLKERITGEALFLRSLMYYHLAIAFGNIPLELEPYEPNVDIVQVEAAVVYDQLIVDLKNAVKLLPISYTDNNIGRATQGAAATLLAKVLLTTGQNSAAADVLRKIINANTYELVENYEDLWGVENENNKESIFEIQFMAGGIGQGSSFTNDFSPSAFLQTGQGFGRNRPNDNLVNSYVAGSDRFKASIGTSYVNEEGETILANYIKKYESQPTTENDSDLNFIVFRYADVLLMLAEAIGESPESYALINQIRTRAGLSGIDASTPGTFKEKLLEERQLEFAFENHRWPALKRFGFERRVFENTEPLVEPAQVRDLYFIPQRVIDINPSFDQNNK